MRLFVGGVWAAHALRLQTLSVLDAASLLAPQLDDSTGCSTMPLQCGHLLVDSASWISWIVQPRVHPWGCWVAVACAALGEPAHTFTCRMAWTVACNPNDGMSVWFELVLRSAQLEDTFPSPTCVRSVEEVEAVIIMLNT
eukprot:4494305-Amphidinium_carterae.1